MPDPIVSYTAFHHSPTIIRNSLGRIAPCESLSEIVSFILFSHATTIPRCLKVAWDLGEFAKEVLHFLPPDKREELSKPPHRTYHGPHKIYYIPGKVLAISSQGTEASIYDLGQYYPDHQPRTLEEVQLLAEELVETLDGLGCHQITTLVSPVAIATASGMLSEYDDTAPSIFDAPEPFWGAHDTALLCANREWVENFQVGYYPELYTHDLSSAYPFHASQLLDLRDCVFERKGEVDWGAYYGFMTGRFTVHPDHPLAWCSPFVTDRGDGVLVNFTGTVDEYPCSLDEVRVLSRYGMGEFRIGKAGGWFIRPANGVHPRQPFKRMMEDLYRQRGEGELTSYIVKRVMNGVIGKWLETRREKDGGIRYGEHYNPIYYTTAIHRTRLQVFEFIARSLTRDEVAHVGIDGVKATRRIPLPKGNGMGRWRVGEPEETLVLSPGGILHGGRRFKGWRCDELVREMRERPGARKYPSGNRGKGELDLGELFLLQTRRFDKLPRTGGGLMGNQYLSTTTQL